MPDERPLSLPQYQSHSRDWHDNLYVYPVISRRGGGLSIGVNLNPDKACNFDCVYCQVDRQQPSRVRDVDVEVLRLELADMIEQAKTGALWNEPEFGDVPEDLRRINDIAFSGDGEPTTCKHFRECVELSGKLKRSFDLSDVKLILITDACYLTKPGVAAALTVMDDNRGEIWAKLDAGTEAYYQKVNRPNHPLSHVIENITSAARARPLVIQSLFMRIDGQPPLDAEIEAFAERLGDITSAGGGIRLVQVYTVARRPAEPFVSPLSDTEVDHIVDLVRHRTDLPVEAFYGAG